LKILSYLTCVSPDMALQQPSPRKCFSTNVAFTGKRMSPDVHA